MFQLNAPPEKMCRKHLLSEHAEAHRFIGRLNKGNDVEGYITRGQVDIRTLRERHHILAKEMLGRGIKHKSPLPDIDPKMMQKWLEIKPCIPDAKTSTSKLYKECDDCRQIQKGKNCG